MDQLGIVKPGCNNLIFVRLAGQLCHCVMLFVCSAVDDVPKADELRTLVKDIWDLRMAKLRKSVDSFMSSDSMVAKVNNLTLMEMNNVREFLSTALSVRQKLKTNTNLNFTLGDSQLLDSRLNDSRFSAAGSSTLNDTTSDTF